jgi:hypothetical protein
VLTLLRSFNGAKVDGDYCGVNEINAFFNFCFASYYRMGTCSSVTVIIYYTHYSAWGKVPLRMGRGLSCE